MGNYYMCHENRNMSQNLATYEGVLVFVSNKIYLYALIKKINFKINK